MSRKLNSRPNFTHIAWLAAACCNAAAFTAGNCIFAGPVPLSNTPSPIGSLDVSSGVVNIFTGSPAGSTPQRGPTISFNGQTFQGNVQRIPGELSFASVFNFNSIDIGPGVTVNATGAYGLVLQSQASATIDSRISLNGGNGGYNVAGAGAPGGYSGGTPTLPHGQGHYGGAAGYSATSADTNALGFGFIGGSGGGAGLPLNRGGTYGGGGGGGAIQIEAYNNLNINAAITANGGNGSMLLNGGGGGGGAGGTVWLAARVITFGTAGVIRVSGGQSGQIAHGTNGTAYIESTNFTPTSNPVPVNASSDMFAYGQTQPNAYLFEFGRVNLGQQSLNEVTLTGNTAVEPFVVSNAVLPIDAGFITGLTGPQAGEFKILPAPYQPGTSGISSTGYFDLPSGAGPAAFEVQFSPTVSGLATAYLNYTSMLGDGSIQLVGYGQPTPEPGSFPILAAGAASLMLVFRQRGRSRAGDCTRDM